MNLPSAGQANLEGELNKIIFNDGKVPPDSYEGNSTDTTEENMPFRKKKRRSVSVSCTIYGISFSRQRNQ